jgi:predicted GNAT superfamily acetyltransferase
MSSKPSPLTIRDIDRLSEMHDVEKLQKEIWGVADIEIFPALALVAMKEVGAVLIGAFDRDQMVGFVFGFPGLSNGRVVIHSDMLGVKPSYRAFGLGRKLKLAQRDRALALGIERITWTFDPLQSVNAHLNFARLAVIADRYEIDFYGETSSFLHRIGTDRLWVTWLLNSPRVIERIAEGSHASVAQPFLANLPALVHVGPVQEPQSNDCAPGDERTLIEIIDDATLLRSNEQLALRWREATREAFGKAIDSGYVVEEFWRQPILGKGVYLLRRVKGIETLAGTGSAFHT